MKTTLVVENHSQFEDFLSINLFTWLGLKTVFVKSAKSAIEYIINNDSKPDLIISKYKINSSLEAPVILTFLKENSLNIPFFSMGQKPKDSEISSPHFTSILDIKLLIQECAKSLKITAKQMVHEIVPDYFPIPIQHFNLIENTNTVIYTEEDGTYQPVLAKDAPVDSLIVKDMIAQGHMHVYIKKEDRLRFVSHINHQIAAKLEIKELNPNDKLVALDMSQRVLQQSVKRLGITQETIELSRRNMKEMTNAVKAYPSLKKLLKRLLANKTSYEFKHSQMLMYIATQMLNQLDWVNEEQVQKLQFICFWHDIALENSEQCMIHTEKDLRASTISETEKHLVKNHAQIAATIISKYPNAPIGVEQIIKQHHGMPNGVGFSEHYGQNISPLAIVFILAEDLVDSILKANTSFKFEVKILQMRKRYETQRFQKIIDVLERIIK